jgi:hypothetical protein
MSSRSAPFRKREAGTNCPFDLHQAANQKGQHRKNPTRCGGGSGSFQQACRQRGIGRTRLLTGNGPISSNWLEPVLSRGILLLRKSVKLLLPGLHFIPKKILPVGGSPFSGPFPFQYECNRIARGERATVRGCAARQLSSRPCRTSPLPAVKRLRKLSIIEQGVHQAERTAHAD